jgi:hypothetical protein
MFPKEIISKLYECPKKCREEGLLGPNCVYFAEPIIGSLSPEFVIVGINPGGQKEKQEEMKKMDKQQYEKFFVNRKIDLNNPEWTTVKVAKKGFEAYKELFSTHEKMQHYNVFGSFKENVAILNVIKCGTPTLCRVNPEKLIKAKNNCVEYLVEQFNYMRPKVVLCHGKFACKTMMALLKEGKLGMVTGSSENIDVLTEKIDMSFKDNFWKNNEVGKTYVRTIKDNNKTLFVFSKHLSRHKLSVDIEMVHKLFNLEEKVN